MTILKSLPIFQTQCRTTYLKSIRRKKMTRATSTIGESFDEAESQTLTSNWLQELQHNMTPSDADAFRPWPNSIRTRGEGEDTKKQDAQKKTNAQKATSVTSHSTANVWHEMAYVGGMNCARTRSLETASSKAGRGKKSTIPSPASSNSNKKPHGISAQHHPHFRRHRDNFPHIDLCMKQL